MIPNDSELRISFWRDGQTQSERFAAAVLTLFGFEEIDPQSPLGGPDGKKDIVCLKGAYKWICGVYFPNSPKTFSTIKKKFVNDLEGVVDGFNGFVFFTNQNLTPKQRTSLEKIATDKRKYCEIIHLQRIQSVLDSAKGYGIRVQYLKIPMTVEEQVSWFAEADRETQAAIKEQTRLIQALSMSMHNLHAGQSHIISTLGIPKSVGIVSPDLLSTSSYSKTDDLSPLSERLSPEIILFTHRLVCLDLPNSSIGKFRSTNVRIGDHTGRIANHIELTKPENISKELTDLCQYWNDNCHKNLTNEKKYELVANFHANFLKIHPFIDGNGRVARTLLMQQIIDFFSKVDMSLFSQGSEYYSALKEADRENYEALSILIKKVVV